MTNIARRDLLKATLAVTTCAALPTWLGSAAASPKPRNLIVLLASGGWDTTYALDPKPGNAIIDEPDGELRRFGELSILTHPSRPKVAEYFERWADRTAVVNGIQVRSFIHSDCTKRIMTGTPSDANPDLGAIAAFEHGRELPVPYLVLGNSALSGPMASITGRAGTTNQIAALLAPEAAYFDPGGTAPSPGLEPSAGEEAAVRRYLEASAERVRATRGQLGANQRQLDAFLKSLERGRLLREFARDQPGLKVREYTPDLGVQIDVAVTALEGGLSHSVMLENSGWDTHDDNSEQVQKHDALYAALGDLLTKLEARALLESTVVCVLSEMGRTPKLNAGGGKDHWPVTSALVIGAGVRGGRTIGASDDQLGARSIDLASGASSEQGKQLQTGNLVAGVLSLTGVDPEGYFPGVEPLRALGA
jgi:hypothetical protein